MIAILLVGAAAALFLWPSPPKAASVSLAIPAAPAVPQARATPSYQQALLSLAAVRQRLADTECLNEAERKAVDQIVISLVAGSDK